MAIKLRRVIGWTALLGVIAMCAAGGYAWVTSTNACDDTTRRIPSHPMKAITYCDYGSTDGVRLTDVEIPVPGDSEVLVAVRAAAVNALDWHFVLGTPYVMRLNAGLRKPKVIRLGVDFSGTVEAVGKAVTAYKPGDEVFGTKTGAFAQFVTVRATSALARKPANITFAQAAAVPVAAVTALQGLRDRGQLRPGQKVLINGASGGVGTFAVQIAKSMGGAVTGVCSASNADLVRSLGADQTIDYAKEDYSRTAERYDLIIDNVGNRSLSENRRILTPHGRYVQIGGGGPNDGKWIGPLGRLVSTRVTSWFVSQELGMMLASTNAADLAALADMIAAGKMTPAIDREFALADAAAAIRYVQDGHARAKVVIAVR